MSVPVSELIRPGSSPDERVFGALKPVARVEIPVFSELELESYEKDMEKIVALTALAAANSTIGLEPIPEGTPKKDPILIARKDRIDNIAGKILASALARLPYRIEMDGEGAKDNAFNGQGVEIVKGNYGNGEDELEGRNDPVDGTEFLAKNLPRAISVAAVTEKGGIAEANAHYYMKLFAPNVEGLSIKDPPQVTIERILAHANLQTPEERQRFILTTLDREANAEIIQAANEAGITLDTLDGGDVIPAIFAGMQEDGSVRALFTRGGGPELLLGAVAARARGNIHVEAIEWNENPNAMASNPVLSLDDLVPGRDGFVAIAHITDDNRHIGQRGIPNLYGDQPIPHDQAVNTRVWCKTPTRLIFQC